MAIFGLGKKIEKQESCCQGASETAKQTETSGAPIKVLGSGCAKCRELEENTRQALRQMGMETAIDHVTDFAQIAAYGVMSTPALVVNDKVAAYGKVLKTDEIIKILQKTN